MNTIIVNRACTASVPGLAPKAFVPGDKLAPWSPFYFPVLWAGWATDSGTEDTAGAEQGFRPDLVVISETDPELGAAGVWIQTFPNGDWTMWIEDGT